MKRFKPLGQGPHMIYTEAQTLDQALRIINNDKRYAKQRGQRRRTLQLDNSSIKLSPLFCDVTLSDRVVPRRMRTPHPKLIGKTVVWSEAEVIAAYATKNFNIRDLSLRAKVPSLQIWFWVSDSNWRPKQWMCSGCKELSGNICRQHREHPHCTHCGLIWNAGLKMRNTNRLQLKVANRLQLKVAKKSEPTREGNLD